LTSNLDSIFSICPFLPQIWLERARTWKSYETPVGLSASEASEALEDILVEFFSKLQKTLGSAVAKYAAGYITLSSHGLTEVELEDVLSCNNEVLQEVYHGINPPSTKVMRIPPLYVARFLHALRSFLKEKYIDGIRVVTWMHQSFPSVYLTALPGINAERIHADLTEIYECETDVAKNITLDNPPQVLENVRRLVRPQPLTAKNVRKLAALPYHMLLKTPEMGDELHAVKERLFNNLKWLMTKIEAFTIDGVLEDLRMALDLKTDEDTRELYDVLRQAGPNIGGDPTLLPIEIISRLKPHGSFEILYNQSLEYIRDQEKAQLLPLYPCLPGTKEILVDSIPGCTRVVDALEDEGLIAFKCDDGKVSVYSIETNEFTHHMENFPDPDQSVTSFVSEDKQRMMSLIGNNLRVWNFKSGASIKEFEIRDEDMDDGSDITYTSLDVTKDGTTALVGTSKGGLVIVDTTFESVRKIDNAHTRKVAKAFYTHDYKKIVSIGEDDLIINVWLVKTLEVIQVIILPSTLIKDQTCLLMDDEKIICPCANYTIVIACLKTGDILVDLPVETNFKMMTSLAIDDDFAHALTGGEDDVIRLWNLTEGKLDKEIPVYAFNCTSVAITDDGEYGGAAFDNPRVMKIYHLSSGDCLKEIKAIRDKVTFLGCVR
jgi:WD40 repeat protein